MSGAAIDPVALASALIRCPSVTPDEGGALDVLERTLTPLGFRCRRMPFESATSPRVDNLWAVRGSDNGPHLCFAGHTDVVPPGASADWRYGPFEPKVTDGFLYGRGAADMKGAIACFVAAAAQFLTRQDGGFAGRISLLITGDEEGPAVNGTKRMLETLAAEGERIDACVVGEPTNPERLGEMIKIGRRGSMTGQLTVHGVQGHTAYPQRADNPVHRLLRMLEPCDRNSSRCRLRAFRSLDLPDLDRRCRQSGNERHSGKCTRKLQYPLQRPSYQRQPRTASSPSVRRRGRTLCSRTFLQRRSFPDAAGRVQHDAGRCRTRGYRV
jgi:acetylornithine deacetylase/succinyl-diaminopimelate desuccinylase-like protein